MRAGNNYLNFCTVEQFNMLSLNIYICLQK